MKPRSAPLECLGYFVTEMAVEANPKHDPGKNKSLNVNDVQVDANAIRHEGGDNSRWRVVLTIKQEVDAEKNAPYNFRLGMMGEFRVGVKVAEDVAERLIRTNASSILYGAAREILRTAMATGPFPPLLLPSVSFYYEPGTATDAKAPEPEAKPKARPRRKRALNR